MQLLTRTSRLAIVTALALGLAAGMTRADAQTAPPDWNGFGTGSTKPGVGVNAGRGIDAFSGYSTHVGWYTGSGSHVLDTTTGAFQGQATWKAATGDTLHVTYTGNVVPSGNPTYPYSFKGTLRAVGGTGRLAHATGTTEWRGAYTGVPGQLFFTFDGNLAGAPVGLAPENFQAAGQVGFTNVQKGILPGGIVPYTGVAQSPLIGPDFQTGTIRNLTGLIPVDSTTFLFLGEVGPNALLPKKANVHLISTGQGDIYCTWTAIFTLKVLDASGDAVFSGDGDFRVTGGSGRYQGASGRFRTVFVTYPVPAGADAAVAGVVQSGNILRK